MYHIIYFGHCCWVTCSCFSTMYLYTAIPSSTVDHFSSLYCKCSHPTKLILVSSLNRGGVAFQVRQRAGSVYGNHIKKQFTFQVAQVWKARASRLICQVTSSDVILDLENVFGETPDTFCPNSFCQLRKSKCSSQIIKRETRKSEFASKNMKCTSKNSQVKMSKSKHQM